MRSSPGGACELLHKELHRVLCERVIIPKESQTCHVRGLEKKAIQRDHGPDLPIQQREGSMVTRDQSRSPWLPEKCSDAWAGRPRDRPPTVAGKGGLATSTSETRPKTPLLFQDCSQHGAFCLMQTSKSSYLQTTCTQVLAVWH